MVRWKQFGVALDIRYHTLQNIEFNRRVEERIFCVVDEWFNTEEDPTLNKLVTALVQMGLLDIAHQIWDNFHSGQEGFTFSSPGMIAWVEVICQ